MSFPGFVDENRDGESGMGGVAVGIVTDNEDPEGMGRVKLEFPWRDADDESHWARIATPMAGPEMGTYFLPEVGDEVLVAFEDGDIHYPYVLGCLWNGKQAPPVENTDGENDIRTIRSRSGHEIVMDDADAGGTVEITTAAGHSITLDDAAESVAVEDKSGQTITLDSAAGAVEVVGGTKVSVNAPTVELKGDGNVTIEAGGVLTLKGSLVQIN